MFRIHRCLLVLLAVLLAAPAFGGEADLSGTWLLEMDGKSPSGEKTAEVTFENGDDGLVVHLAGKKGTVECPGTLEGDELTFEYTSPKKKASATYRGKVRGELMGGDVAVGSRQIKWWARRAQDDNGFQFDGTWTFFIKGEPHDYANLTKMTFSQDGPELIVTLKANDMEVECRGSLEGNNIRFEYHRQKHDGSGTYVAVMTGSISGALMSGDADLGEYGKTTWRATLDVE